MDYAIFSESIDDNLEWAKTDYEVIKKELVNGNPDFNKSERQLVIKIEKDNGKNNEDWILLKAKFIAKKYGLKYIEVSKKSNEYQKYYDVSLLLSFDHCNEIKSISNVLGNMEVWRFTNGIKNKYNEPINKLAALKNILE